MSKYLQSLGIHGSQWPSSPSISEQEGDYSTKLGNLSLKSKFITRPQHLSKLQNVLQALSTLVLPLSSAQTFSGRTDPRKLNDDIFNSFTVDEMPSDATDWQR